MQTDRHTRLAAINGLRGLFMVLMITSHFAVLFPAELQYLKFHYFGYVENTQGFVFLSGVTVGIFYGHRLIHKGFASLVWSVLGRIRKIYLCQVVLIISVMLMTLAFWDGTTRDGMFRAFAEYPVAFPLASIGLLTAAPFIHILPLYIALMAITPLVLLALAHGHTWRVTIASVLIWALAQTGLPQLAHDSAKSVFVSYEIYVPLGTNFNFLAWQLLYVAGLVFGFKYAKGSLDLGHFSNRKYPWLLPIVLLAAVLIACLDIAENLGFLDFLTGSLAGHFRRFHLPFIYVASFVTEAYLLAWLLLAGTQSRFALVRWLSENLNKFSRLPFLTQVGQHAIWVYAYHVLFLYCWALFADFTEPGFLLRNMIFLAVGASTYPVALLGGWLENRSYHPGWTRPGAGSVNPVVRGVQ